MFFRLNRWKLTTWVARPMKEPNYSEHETIIGDMQCHACHAELPKTALFCLRCGEPQTKADAIVNGLETCEIAWWRGFVMSEFYAIAVRHDGTVMQVYRSPSFRWRREHPPPRLGSAVAAQDTLVKMLLRDNWETVGCAPHWYGVRFRRRIGSPSRTADPHDDTNVLDERGRAP